jgi:glycosyltransferase involved in cell wall biosynthesis
MIPENAHKQPLISLIVPVYNESDGIYAFFDRVKPILEGLGKWEIICINDGSADNTLKILEELHQKDKRIKAISLSRNFGKEAAMTAGLDYANGDVVIPIDADLQDPPELIPSMLDKWHKGAKVVLATRKNRDESWLKRKSANGFYGLMGKVSTVKIPKNTGDFRLMDRQVVEAIKQLPERTRFMKGLFAWAGFPTEVIHFDRPQRHAGTTKWNYFKLWKFALDGIFSFTTLPLKIWTYIGMFISFLSFIYGSYLIIHTMVSGVDVPGYASIMVVMLFLGGIQLMSLGIIGEYIGRIYRETKHRPIYLIEKKIGL